MKKYQDDCITEKSIEFYFNCISNCNYELIWRDQIFRESDFQMIVIQLTGTEKMFFYLDDHIFNFIRNILVKMSVPKRNISFLLKSLVKMILTG